MPTPIIFTSCPKAESAPTYDPNIHNFTDMLTHIEQQIQSITLTIMAVATNSSLDDVVRTQLIDAHNLELSHFTAAQQQLLTVYQAYITQLAS